MRCLVIGDVHWSSFSSILRKMGDKYSKRLENLINSINWVEEQAEILNVDKIIYAGDFFDKTTLNADEITALQEVAWANIPHLFLIGNHEGLTSTLDISTTHIFQNIPNCAIIDKPTLDIGFGYQLILLPYILEKDRKSLKEYHKQLWAQEGNFFTTQEVKKIYYISHNDIKMFYGNFESKEGFDPDEIDRSCELFINGHIHNYSKFSKKGINIGNLTGQNFSEDASKYNHNILLLDTLLDTYNIIENPFAYNFYKLEFNNLEELIKYNFKCNSVLSVKIPESQVVKAREYLDSISDIVKEYRVISVPNLQENSLNENGNEEVIEAVNHLEEFVKFISENFDMTDILKEELREVCKE